MPTFNSTNYLRATLESLAQQEERDFEVIVIDDGSVDDSVPLASGLLSQFNLQGEVQVRGPDQRPGASTCRNIGLRAAQGEWIAFLDSDDLFEPTKLAEVAQAIQQFGDVAGAVYHKSARFDDLSGKIINEVSAGGAIGEPRWLLDQLLTGNFHATCGMVIRREILLQIGGFDPALNGVEDWWLVLQVSKRTPWVFLDRTLARIRVRSRSLMMNQPFVHYVDQHIALLRAARASGELDGKQLGELRSYTMGPLTQYFAGIDAARSGRRSLLPGLKRMAVAGYAAEALRLGYRQLRGALLSGAVGFVRGRPVSQ